MVAVAGTVATPWQYAEELLACASSALPGTRGGAIDFTFVDHEVTAFDCSLLAVLMGGITIRTADRRSELGAGHASTMGWLNIVNYRIVVVRECIPVDDGYGNPPTSEQRTDAMKLCAEDVWAIWHAIMLKHGDGSLFTGPCLELFLDNAAPIPVQGMVAGWTITLRAGVPGYAPVLA